MYKGTILISSIPFDEVVPLSSFKFFFKITIQAGLHQGLKKVLKGKSYINDIYPNDR